MPLSEFVMSGANVICRLHYVQAVTWEVLRMANLIPFTIPHFTEKSVELFGYRVPKVSKIAYRLSSSKNNNISVEIIGHGELVFGDDGGLLGRPESVQA